MFMHANRIQTLNIGTCWRINHVSIATILWLHTSKRFFFFWYFQTEYAHHVKCSRYFNAKFTFWFCNLFRKIKKRWLGTIGWTWNGSVLNIRKKKKTADFTLWNRKRDNIKQKVFCGQNKQNELIALKMHRSWHDCYFCNDIYKSNKLMYGEEAEAHGIPHNQRLFMHYKHIITLVEIIRNETRFSCFPLQMPSPKTKWNATKKTGCYGILTYSHLFFSLTFLYS